MTLRFTEQMRSQLARIVAESTVAPNMTAALRGMTDAWARWLDFQLSADKKGHELCLARRKKGDEKGEWELLERVSFKL